MWGDGCRIGVDFSWCFWRGCECDTTSEFAPINDVRIFVGCKNGACDFVVQRVVGCQKVDNDREAIKEVGFRRGGSYVELGVREKGVTCLD